MSNGKTLRRGSVFGALLLIGLGGLFLYANLQPEFNLWPLLAKYWPLLIIFWGLAKLADYFLLRGTPEAAATRLGGGTIVGLIFLILIGWCFTQIVEHGWWTGPGIVIGDGELGCLFASEYEFTDELVEPLTAPATLRLSNARGALEITAGPGEELHVLARKKVCAPNEGEASRLADAFQPILEETAEGYEFRWEAEGIDSRAIRADLTIQVPPGVSLRLSSRRGDVAVSGIEGDLALDLNRGDAVLERIQGNVSVELHRGSVLLAEVTGDARVEGRGEDVTFRDIRGTATLEGAYHGALQFIRIGGPARFQSRRTEFSVPRVDGEVIFVSDEILVRGIPGDLRVKTRSKEIELEEVAGRVEVENRSGPVVLRFRTPPTQDIAVETRSGDIELYLPEASAFQITARARDGEIKSDFRGPGLSLQRQGDDALLNGTYGATPPASIRLSTTYGTIYLRYTLPGATSD